MESFQPTNTVIMFLSSATRQDGGLMILVLPIFVRSIPLSTLVTNLNFQTLNMVIGNVQMAIRKTQLQELFVHLIVMEETKLTTLLVSQICIYNK